MDNGFEVEQFFPDAEYIKLQDQKEEKQTCSEDEENELQNKKNEPWQCSLPNLSERVLALYKNGNFTDITLTFPGSDITYDAHRLILAISSPVFEGMLYGPMRTEGPNVLLYGDDPLIMKYLIAHCYGEDLEPPDMDIALEVYKLADKYLLDALKKDCCKHIVNQMDPYNHNDVIEFSEMFNYDDLKSNCLPLVKEMFEEAQNDYENECDEGVDDTEATRILMSLSNEWIGDLLSEVSVKILDFQESWKYPESPLEVERLRAILSSQAGGYLEKFYGCIPADSIRLFPVVHTPKNKIKLSFLELCLSVTDPWHAKRVIEAINQQNGFENNLIAIHIRCQAVWREIMSPIRPERTHRPSLLLISDADDDKASWVVEAAKAFLPQREGSYSRVFRKWNKGDIVDLEPVNILKLPRSKFTPNGFINMLYELCISGVKCHTIMYHSPYISHAHEDVIKSSIRMLEDSGFNPRLLMVDEDLMFRNVFDIIQENVGIWLEDE